MEPRIQYAKTSDGVSIAYWTLGEGMPFVATPSIPWSHIQREWQWPGYRAFYEGLIRGRRLVRYDNRGSGLSDRDVNDYSLEAHILDMEAVVDRMKLDRFALMGLLTGSPVAIAYAARHPQRVSHLLLWGAFATASEYYSSPQLKAFRKLRDEDWETYTETVGHASVGWSEPQEARRMAAYMRECVTQRTSQAILREGEGFDVSDALLKVELPTLVLHPGRGPLPMIDLARGLASGIPDARLVVLENTALLPWVGDLEAVLDAIDEFLGEGEEPESTTELPEGMAVILFADIVESTALTERMGDAAFREKARELDTSLRTIIRECAGTPVEGKLVGDGVLAVFTSARQAIECALRCNAASDSVDLRLHLGIHAGDVIREGNNVYGGAVNIAARIAGASAPGEVLVSDTVRGLARTSAGVAFDDKGEQSLKGVADPQRLFAVREGG
jgi:class 3 adenylate cyclase